MADQNDELDIDNQNAQPEQQNPQELLDQYRALMASQQPPQQVAMNVPVDQGITSTNMPAPAGTTPMVPPAVPAQPLQAQANTGAPVPASKPSIDPNVDIFQVPGYEIPKQVNVENLQHSDMAAMLPQQQKLMEEYEKLKKKTLDKLQEAQEHKTNATSLIAMLDAANQISSSLARGHGADIKNPDLSSLKEAAALPEAQAKEQAGIISAFGKGQGITPYQMLRQDYLGKNLGVKATGLNETLSKDVYTRQQQQEPSDTQSTQLAGYNNTENMLNQIKDLKKNMPTNIIKYGEQEVLDKLGKADPKYIQMKMILGQALAQQVHTLSGTASSDKERAMLGQVLLPDMKDSDEQFNTKLEEALKQVKIAKQIHIDAIKQQGKNPTGFEKPTENNPDINQTAAYSKQSKNPTEVTRMTKDGKKAVFDADTKEFLRYEQ